MVYLILFLFSETFLPLPQFILLTIHSATVSPSFKRARAVCKNQNKVGTRSSPGFLSDLKFHFLDPRKQQEQEQEQDLEK